MKTLRGFTPLELIAVIAVFILLASASFAFLSDAWRDARDERRITDLMSLSLAFTEYYHDHGEFPAGVSGAIGDHGPLHDLLSPYLTELPTDPAGSDDLTFFYYYDEEHQCGDNLSAAVFAHQMDSADHANYEDVRELCNGVLDSEGRGEGEASYTIILQGEN